MDEISIGFSVPGQWFIFGGDSSNSTGSVSDQVKVQLKERKDLRRYRELIIEAVENYGRRCRSEGAILSAMRWDVTRDKQQSPLFAFLEVNGLTLDEGGATTEEIIERTAEELAEPDPDDVVPPQVEVVDLDAGRAVRRQSVCPAGDEGIPRLVVEFYLPLAGTDKAITLQFSSGNLAAASIFIPEYDFIACHMRIQPAK